MKKIFILCLLLLSTVITNAQIVYLKGVLQGAQEVPATATGAGGVVILKYNMATNFLELWGNYRNLSSTISGSHIHGPALPGNNAPVLVNLTNTGGTSGGLKGLATLTAAQEADLIAGQMYVNVHSQPPYENGEIRAQITRVTQDKAVFFNGRLQGAQSAPPNNSTAFGTVNALIDTATHTLWLSSYFTGLTTPATNAHIHVGPPSVSPPGNVIVQLNWSSSTTGSVDSSRVISVQNETDILSGNSYVNIHNSTFPGGEIRAQLLQYTNLRYFAGVLQGSQEVPQVTTPGRGTVIAKYNTETNVFELTGDYQLLTSNVTQSHVHGPAPVGSVANPVFDLTNTGGTMGTLTVTRTITEDQEVQLLAGDWYANLHTVNNGNGEVRGQLMPLSPGETQYLTAAMDADEERLARPTPPITSSGIGTSVAVLDKITRNIYLTGSYTNLSVGISDAHIHRGAVGVSGPVSIQLQYVAGATSGTVTGSATNISASLMDSIINGNSYVNIHTNTIPPGGGGYPGGEIRGQLGNLVLPVKLKTFNGYKDQNKISLQWQIAEELHLKGYEVEEQSTDGKWLTKGFVAANGGRNAASYKFNDVPLSAKSNYVLYRLKMIDFDGKITYSNTLRINYMKTKAELMILTNPVLQGNLRFIITGTSVNKKVDVSVVDYNGRIVARSAAASTTNNNLDINHLAPGMYNLVVLLDGVPLQQSFLK